MEQALIPNEPMTTAEAEAALDRIIAEIDAIFEEMRGTDAEIARLKAESAELKAETRAILDGLARAIEPDAQQDR